MNKRSQLATSGDPVAQDWLDRFNRLETAKTYSAILATALLARAVDARADARVLMARADAEGHIGYPARGLFTKVIFELCSVKDVSLGTIGREPHNNQPFFGNPVIDDRVRSRVDPSKRAPFDYFEQCLDAANTLDPPVALNAFAAFLRFSLEHGPKVRLSDFGRFNPNLNAIESKVRGLMASGVEGGSRGEAAAHVPAGTRAVLSARGHAAVDSPNETGQRKALAVPGWSAQADRERALIGRSSTEDDR